MEIPQGGVRKSRGLASGRANILAISLCVALGVGLRLTTWNQVFSSGRAIPLSADSVYHLRRARFAVRDFPKPLVFDPLINYPDGGVVIWPPLFDVALAAPAFLLGGSRAGADLVERTSVFVPLLFAAGAIAAAGLAGRLVRRRRGWAAALFLAVCAGHFRYSQLGHTDQHVAEACLGFLALALFLRSCRRDSALLEALTGVVVAAAVLTWQGAIFWPVLLGCGLIREAFLERARSTLRRVLLILLLPTALVAAGTRFWLLGFEVPFSYVNFGWFQPIFLGFVTAAVAAALLLRRARAMSPRQRALALAVILGCLIPVAGHSQDFFSMTIQGIRHVASASRGAESAGGAELSLSRWWLAQIAEYQPLFGDGWKLSVRLLSFSFLLSPLVILGWALRSARGVRPAESATLAAWGGFTFLFTVFQQRNVYYASLLAALAALEICGRASAWAARRISIRGRAGLRSGAFYGVFAILAAPMAAGLRAEAAASYGPGTGLLRLLERLKAMNPRPIDPYDRRFLDSAVDRDLWRHAPSVMDSWSLGHYVTYYAEWPVVADNFGYGFEESVHFFYASSETRALEIARRHRSVLVLDDGLLPRPSPQGKILEDLPPFWISTPGGWVARARYLQTIEVRLYDFDGKGASPRAGITIEPLPHFRFLESAGPASRRFGRLIPRWKLFALSP